MHREFFDLISERGGESRGEQLQIVRLLLAKVEKTGGGGRGSWRDTVSKFKREDDSRMKRFKVLVELP